MDSTTWIVYVLLLFGVYSILEFIYRYRVTTRGKKRIPTHVPLPLIGNLLNFPEDRSSFGILEAMASYLPSCPISAVWFGPKLLVLVAEPKLACSLMVKGIASKRSPDIYSPFDLVSNGLFSSRYLENWATLRKPIDKLLEPKFVEFWMEIFNKNSDLFCEAIDSNKDHLHLPLLTFTYSMSNVAETHLGLPNRDSYLHLLPTLLEDMEDLLSMTMRRVLDITIRPDMLFKRSKHYPEFLQAKQRVMKTYNQMQDVRKAYLKKNNLDLDVEGCYIDFVMARAEELNYDEEETFKLGIELFVAAVHTTTFTLSSAILFLAMHPECQKKLYEEIQTVFSESTGALTKKQLDKMQYLDMVTKETLRHAGVTGVGRQLEEEVEVDGYIIPKNSILLLNLVQLSYNPKYWDRPKEFYPEHFTPEAEKARPKGAFLPFSYGARGCPGKQFGMITIKMALMKAVQQFEFSSELRFEDVEYNFSIIKTPTLNEVVAKRRTPLKN